MRILDDLIRIPGTNFGIGLDPILGLLPVGGDVASSAASTYLLFVALKEGVPLAIVVRMAFYLILDAALGSLPLAGDVFDLFFRANTRVAALIRKHAGERRPATFGDYLFVAMLFVVMAGCAAAPIVLLYYLLSQVWDSLKALWP